MPETRRGTRYRKTAALPLETTLRSEKLLNDLDIPVPAKPERGQMRQQTTPEPQLRMTVILLSSVVKYRVGRGNEDRRGYVGELGIRVKTAIRAQTGRDAAVIGALSVDGASGHWVNDQETVMRAATMVIGKRRGGSRIEFDPTLTPIFGIWLLVSHLWAVRKSLALRVRGSGDRLLSTNWVTGHARQAAVER